MHCALLAQLRGDARLELHPEVQWIMALKMDFPSVEACSKVCYIFVSIKPLRDNGSERFLNHDQPGCYTPLKAECNTRVDHEGKISVFLTRYSFRNNLHTNSSSCCFTTVSRL